MGEGSEPDVAREVRRAIVELTRGHYPEGSLHDDLSLSAGGLGLDSVSLAELLVVLGDRLGTPVAEVLERPSGPTVGELIAHALVSLRSNER